MLPGYGVSEVAVQLRRGLKNHGWDLHVGFLDGEPSSDGQVLFIPADPTEIVAYCLRNKIDVVVAQTSPYFEILPVIARDVPVVCYEHGDPTPAFFHEEANIREQVWRNKIENVYPHVAEVWTTSHFLRHDIEWLGAKVIPLAADHVGQRDSEISPVAGRKIRAGSLARMGALESEYKGTDLLMQLPGLLPEQADVEFLAMGRGSRDDAKPLEEAGWNVLLNASDEERRTFLQSLDVFISPSKWEGFNLPLVEAQFLGVPGIAFDVGAHPETTPFAVGTVDEASALIGYWINDHVALRAAGDRCKQFVDAKFSWDRTAQEFASALDGVAARSIRGPVVVRRVRSVIRRDGVMGLLKKISRRMLSR